MGNRYIRYAANEPAYKFYSTAVPPIPKNPNGNVTDGPAFFTNCTNRATSAYHELSFRFIGTGVFNAGGVGSHMVAIQRAFFKDFYVNGERDGIGASVFGIGSVPGGNGKVYAQRLTSIQPSLYDSESTTGGTPFVIQDGVEYEVFMRASADEIFHMIKKVSTGEVYWPSPGWRPAVGGVNGNGIGIVLLCNDGVKLSCEINQSWRLDIFNISAS